MLQLLKEGLFLYMKVMLVKQKKNIEIMINSNILIYGWMGLNATKKSSSCKIIVLSLSLSHKQNLNFVRWIFYILGAITLLLARKGTFGNYMCWDHLLTAPKQIRRSFWWNDWIWMLSGLLWICYYTYTILSLMIAFWYCMHA